jgi:hypothetical protein
MPRRVDLQLRATSTLSSAPSMSAVLVCPNCNATASPSTADQPACSVCGTPFPGPISSFDKRTEERQRPFLILLLMVFLAFFALFGALITLITLMVPGSEGYLVDNQLATKDDFLLKMVPSILRFLAAAPIAYGLWKERGWARPMLLAFFAIPELGKYLLPGWREAPASAIIPRLLLSMALVGFLGWYLYRKRSVIDYYMWVRR